MTNMKPALEAILDAVASRSTDRASVMVWSIMVASHVLVNYERVSLLLLRALQWPLHMFWALFCFSSCLEAQGRLAF